MTHEAKLGSADVVAAFDSQMDADAAVLGLRLAGFGDDQIGYLVRNPAGRLIDLVGRTPIVAGAVVGAVLVAFLGLLVAWSITDGRPTSIHGPTGHDDPTAYVAGAVVGVIVGVVLGALCGRGGTGGEEVHTGPEVGPGRFVVTVHAADRRDRALEVIRATREPGVRQKRIHHRVIVATAPRERAEGSAQPGTYTAGRRLGLLTRGRSPRSLSCFSAAGTVTRRSPGPGPAGSRSRTRRGPRTP